MSQLKVKDFHPVLIVQHDAVRHQTEKSQAHHLSNSHMGHTFPIASSLTLPLDRERLAHCRLYFPPCDPAKPNNKA